MVFPVRVLALSVEIPCTSPGLCVRTHGAILPAESRNDKTAVGEDNRQRSPTLETGAGKLGKSAREAGPNLADRVVEYGFN